MAAPIPALLASALRRLRAAGHKLTPARKAVLAVLCESERHLSSTEIQEGVRRREPGTGRASVFRTLELLTRLSIVRPTCLEARAPVYVVLPDDGHHAHLVCPRCRQVVEIEDCDLGQTVARIGREHGVMISGHLLELYGLCVPCREAEAG